MENFFTVIDKPVYKKKEKETKRKSVELKKSVYNIDKMVLDITPENSHEFIEQSKVGSENFEW